MKRSFKIVNLGLILMLVLGAGLPGTAQAEVSAPIGNAGFEEAIGGANNWDDTAGRGISLEVGGAPEGSQFLRLDEDEVAGQFPFTFQTITGIGEGDVVTLTAQGRAALQGADDDVGEIVIEFQDSMGAQLSVETQSFVNPAFALISVSDTAPANTSQVTFVLRIQNAEDTGNGTSVVDFDDVQATVSAVAVAGEDTGSTPVAASNVLGNPGLEEGIGDGNFDNWDSTNGAVRVNNATLNAAGFADAPEGDFALAVTNVTFTFQVQTGVAEGDLVTYSGYAQSSILGALNGGRLKIEFKDDADAVLATSTSQLINASTAEAGAANDYIYFEARGVAPAGTTQAVFVVDTVSGTGFVAVDDLNATVNPVNFSLSISGESVAPGGVVVVLAQYQNTSSVILSDVEFTASFPAGFNVSRASIRKDGQPTSFREGSIIVPVGTLTGSQTVAVSFLTVVTSGVKAGSTYTLTVSLDGADGLALSRDITIRVDNDPLFDEGTVIGKVFHDENQNTVQDNGEKGVPWVKLVTEEGIIIITDEHGRYHIPAMRPGRHIVKIDGHSLPDGTKFISEESRWFHMTPGIMSEINFAVLMPPSDIPGDFQEDLSVSFSQGLDTSRPVLDVQMDPDILIGGLGTLERAPVFRFLINYPEFVKSWFLEVRNETGEAVWTGFGVSAPPSEVTWTGLTEDGLLIKPGIYSYQFKVEDQSGREDWTPLRFFHVISKADPEARQRAIEIPAIGNFNIFEDGKRSIPLIAKPTVRIQGKTQPGYKVRVNSRDIPLSEETGRFHTEFYVTPGEKEFIVEAISPEGKVTSYRKAIQVKDSTFFLVALAEEELGFNLGQGDNEVAGNDGRFEDGFYQDGRLSYFFKGKLKGRFLVESHYDTADRRGELFRNLDPDEYYPVYGDDSTVSYDAINTQQRFYILVEMDRSFIKWGSFQTEFNDTELASYNRTLSGLKAHYETLATTSYGDPKRALTVFWSDARSRADHNEFAATGGSLYYLRYRRVIEGSEKIRVEVRDKIQNMTIHSSNLVEGKDYEIDYDEGRIILSRPLSSVAASDTLVSADILGGSPVFLVVDYEYDTGFNTIENRNRGMRGYTHFGDHIRLGGTAVNENRHGALGTDYDMRAVDLQVKVGRNTKIVAEYAESKQEQVDQGVSYDGGLSFVDPGLLSGQNTRPRENAYLIKGESKPFKNAEISGYIQTVEPSFSNDHLRSQEGTKKFGFAARYKFTDSIYARYRFDSSEAADQLMPFSEHGIVGPFEKRRTHTAQLVYDDSKWLAEVEYLRQMLDLPPDSNLFDSILSEYRFENAIAAKLGYRINDSFFPYAKFQVAFDEQTYYQAGGGLRYQVAQDVFAYVEEMVGNMGDSTLFGLVKHHDQRARSYANIRIRDVGIGSKTLSTTLGSSYGLTENSRVFSEREYSTYDSVSGYADILGYEGKAGDHWDYELRYERRHLDASNATEMLQSVSEAGLARANTFNTASGALAYADGEKFRARVYLEGRLDRDSPRLWQWVNRNSVEYRVNEDLRYLGRLDFGKTRFTQTGDLPGDFLEFNTGFAYRPVNHEKFNMLGRYAYLRNKGNDAQFGSLLGVEQDEIAHIIAVDFAYDVHRYLSFVEKVAYKRALLDASIADAIVLQQLLMVNRLNFHVTRKWDIALEYRFLWQFDAAKTLKQGALIEVDREFYDYVRLGVGYNFTDFDDDLSSSDYDAHGPFVRFTGKF